MIFKICYYYTEVIKYRKITSKVKILKQHAFLDTLCAFRKAVNNLIML